MPEEALKIGIPRHFGIREAVVVNLFGLPGSLAVVAILCAVAAFAGAAAHRASVSGDELAGIRILAFWVCCNLAVILAGLFILPVALANPYVTRIVRRSIRNPGGPGSAFVVQMASCPRIYEGLRGWLEDADDVGYLHFAPDALLFTGDHAALWLPFDTLTEISVHSVGWRGLWLCGKRIRVRSPLLGGRKYIEFMDRSAWTVVGSLRISREILAELTSRKRAVASPNQ